MSDETTVIVVAAAIGVLGMVIGSFLNVVVYRVPAGMSVVHPASACPKCGNRIRGYDNVPVLSWLLLRGKCRDCSEPISARYPAVELGTGLVFAAIALYFAPALLGAANGRVAVAAALQLLAFLYLGAVSVALALIDVDVHRLPNAIVMPSYVVAVVLFAAAALVGGEFGRLLVAGIGAVAMLVFFLVLALLKPGAMGFGDVKLAGVLGLYFGWLGWGPLVVGVFAAFLLGGIVGMVMLLSRRVKRGGGIPFGPWMLAGGWIGIFAGAPIAVGYLNLVGLG